MRVPRPMAAAAPLAVCLAGALLASPKPTVYYLTSSDCGTCLEADRKVREAVRQLGLQMRTLDAGRPEHMEFMQALALAAGGATGAKAPLAVLGERVFAVGDLAGGDVTALFRQTLAGPVPDLGPRAERLRPIARQGLVYRLRGAGLLPVVVAAVADAFNPCAFAALLFLLALLASSKQAPRRQIAFGLVFAAGVFAAYFGLGVGLLSAVVGIRGHTVARRILEVVVGLLCGAAAVANARDAIRLRNGQRPTLALPRSLQRLSHSVVRAASSRMALLGLAFPAGGLLALIEGVCTGQVYLPAIVYLASRTETRGEGLVWLAFYDAIFVLPLIVLTVMAAAGRRLQLSMGEGHAQAARWKVCVAALLALVAVYFFQHAIY